MEISDGGQVIVGGKDLGSVIIAQNADVTGTLYIGAEAGGGAGTLDAGQVEAGSGTAALEFRHSDDGYAFATTKGDGIALTGRLAIRHSGSGETELTGRVTTTNNAGLQVTGGTLTFRHADAGNSIGGGSAAVTVGDGTAGTGTLAVENGATLSIGVNAGGTLLVQGGSKDSEGIVRVSGAGSELNVRGNTFVGREGDGSLRIEHGGRFTGEDGLVVGETGTGTMMVSDTGTVEAYNLIVASGEDSAGTVIVTGAGSTLTATNDVTIGDEGAGVLEIRDGAGMTVEDDFDIANSSGSTGTVLVTGDGSSLAVIDEELVVGGNGVGTLTVEQGGSVTVADDFIVAEYSGSAGSQATVTGQGSTLTVGDAAEIGSRDSGSLTVSDTGAMTVGETLAIGSRNQGTLTVSSGGTIVADEAVLLGGDSVTRIDARGTATVGGSGSHLQANATDQDNIGLGHGIGLVVGYAGEDDTNSLEISDGGRVTVGSDGGGTVEIARDGNVTGALYIGAEAGGGAGTLDAAEVRSGAGAATLEFRHSDEDYAFATTGGDGVALTGRLVIRHSGSGETALTGRVTTMNAGAQVTGGTLAFRYADSQNSIAGINAEVTVGDGTAGTGTLLVETGTSLRIGEDGQVGATLRVQGDGDDGVGTVRVSGAESELIVRGNTIIGQNGDGSLRIEQGGSLTSVNGLVIANAADGAGSVDVTGAGSELISLDHLVVGETGSGTLAVADGGAVRIDKGSGTLQIAQGEDSVGTLVIGSAVGQAALGAGVLEVGGLALGDGAAHLVFNHSDGDYRFRNAGDSALTGEGWTSLRHLGSGTTVLDQRVEADSAEVAAGTLTLSHDDNSFGAAGITVSGGTLSLLADGAAGGAGGSITTTGSTVHLGNKVTNAAAITLASDGTRLRVDATETATQSGAIAEQGEDARPLEILGGGTLVLTGAASHSGTTTVSAGSLRIGAGGTTGSLAGDVALGEDTSLAFDRADSMTFAGAVSGDGQLVQAGTGTTILTGDASHSGGTTVSAGSLRIGAGGTAGSLAGDVTLGEDGTLAFDRSDDVTFAGALSGDGQLLQAGTGTTILTGAASHSGGTTISAGSLRIGAGGTAGSLAGDVTLGEDGTLAFDRADDITFAGALSGDGQLLQAGAGATTLTGAASHSGGTTVSAGSLRIGAGGTTGSLAGDVTLGQSTALVFDRADSLAFAGAVSGDGQLIQAGTGTTILGGVATHSGGTSIENGTLQLGGDDRLSGAGMLTVETAGTFALAEFNQTVWSLSGDGVIDLGSGVLTVVNEADLDFLGSLLGSGRLTVAGAGTLTLVEDSSYTGGTVVDEGTLQFGTGGTSGSLTGDATVAAGAVLAFNRSDLLAYAGAVGGAGMLFQRGSGTLLLSGDSSYSGGTRLDSGTLAVGHDNALGTGTLFANGGALRADGDSRTLANAIAITADSLQLTGAHALTLAGPLSGDGALTVAVEDDAAITLTGAASHGGGTTVQSGSLRIGAGGTSGSLAGDVALGEDGTLAFDRADALTLAGAISGDGGLRQIGIGTTTLSGQIAVAGGLEVANGTLALGHDGNSFGDAGITVSGGTLSLLADGAAGGADGAITTTGSTVHLADGVTNATAVTLDSDSTRLRVEAGETATQAGAIGQANGSARPLEIAGGGTLIFTADNSYSGLTTVAAGTLQLGAGSGGGTSGGFGGDALIADGATLAVNRADDILYDGAIAGAGTLRQIGTGTTTLAGALDMTGSLDLIAGGMVIDTVGGIAGGTAVGSDAWLRLTDDASLQSHASVAGRLTGTGTLGGFSIGSGGTLRPGAADMPGTLTVTGDADFAAGSVYHVYLNATAHSRTNIGGGLSIAGGTVQVTSLLAASPEAHATVLDSPRRILQAEDGVTGQFDELSINYAFLTPELLYGADFVDLVLRFDTDPVDPDPVDPDPVDPDPVDPDPVDPDPVDPDPVDPDPVDPDPVDPDPVDPPGPPAPPQIQASVQNQLNQLPSISANQQSVTNVLGTMQASDPRYQAFVDQLIQVQTEQVSGVVEGLSGSSLGASSGIAPALAGSMLSFIQQQSGVGGQSPSMAQSGVGTLQFASLGASQPGDRPQLSQAMPAPAIDGISRGAVWVRAVGRTGRLGQANGLPGASTRSGGVHAGLEMPVSDNLLVGGALGYEAGRTSTLGADAHVDTTMASAALYGRYAADGLRVSGAAEASWIDHKSVRAIPVFGEQEGRYAARALIFDLEAAYDLARAAPGVTLAPLAGFRFTSLDQDGYEETGTAPLRVEGYTTQSARVRLGGEARFDFAAMGSGPAVLTARAAWSREIGSPTTAVRASLLGSDTFSIRGQALPENLLEGGLTLDVDLSENLQLFGAYNATLGTRFDTHQLQAGLRLRW